jgi:small subunit ribosomal protein S17
MSDEKKENSAARQTALRKSLTGVVVSSRMDKTITILNYRRIKHKKYKKYISRSSKILAHDEKNEANVGDTVMIMECRPLSKRKAWRLVKILKVSQGEE